MTDSGADHIEVGPAITRVLQCKQAEESAQSDVMRDLATAGCRC